MGRRTVLLIVAALIAALGTSLVFMYVRGVDARASAQYDAVKVLKAVEVINPGETLEQAQAAGKIQMGTVGRAQVLPGATTSTADMGQKVALATVYPGEQIITGKFGAAGDQSALTIPDGKFAISVNLTDTGRVAGFVTPGAEVAIFLSATPEGDTANPQRFTRVLLPKVQVIAVGTTTVISTTTTDPAGQQTTEQLPRTLFTLALDQDEAERIMFAQGNGELTFGLLNEKSKVTSGPGVTAKDLFE